MSSANRNRTLVAGCLLAVVWIWTSSRIAAFQVRAQAEKALWSGRFEDALQKYRLLEHFGPSRRKARAGELEVFLSLIETHRRGLRSPSLSEESIKSQIPSILRGLLENECLRSETWSSLAETYAVLKPGNQAQRTYSLEELAGPVHEQLEIEDLLQIRALEVSLELDQNSVYHRDTLADLAWDLGLRDYAKEQYGEVVTILPEPDKHMFLAPGKVSDEMADLVVKSLNRAMQPPRNAPRERVNRTLGMFFFSQGRFQEAYDAFQKSQDVAGRSTASLKALAMSSMGRLDEAIALYREAMVAKELDADDRFYVQVALGDLLDRRGRHREASEILRSALVIKPHDPGTLLLLGRVYESIGLWQDAEDCYVRASEIGSAPISNLAQLVLFYRRIGKPSLALAPARKLLELQPEEPLYRQQIEELEAEIESKGN